MTKLGRRVDHAEGLLLASGSSMLCIVIEGAARTSQNDYAKGVRLSRSWLRHDGESVKDFRKRAKRDAELAGERILIFGDTFERPDRMRPLLPAK